MEKKINNIYYLRRFWLVIFGILICSCIFMAFVPGIKPAELIQLASTTPVPQEPDRQEASSAAARSNSLPVTDPSVNIVTQTAVKLGVLSCISRINQVASFLTANVSSGIFIFPPQSEPDRHIFSTSFELLRPDDSTIYASASFFPNQDAVYDTVEYVNMGPEELEKTVFKDLKRVSVLKKNIILLDGGKVKVFLMPAGNGAVVIKKEVIR